MAGFPPHPVAFDPLVRGLAGCFEARRDRIRIARMRTGRPAVIPVRHAASGNRTGGSRA